MDKIIDILFSNIAMCCYEGIILGLVFFRFLRLNKEKETGSRNEYPAKGKGQGGTA